MQGYLFGMPRDEYIELLRKDKSVPIFMDDHLNFEKYRILLLKGLGYSDGSRGGHPAWDVVMQFKIFIYQCMENLSDKKMEMSIRVRQDLRIFLHLDNAGWKTPDEKTIWLFRERLKKTGLAKVLWEEHNKDLNNLGYGATGGQHIDSSIFEIREQHNTQAEKNMIKEGQVPPDWKEAKVRQKDLDARYGVKRVNTKEKDGKTYVYPEGYTGYKFHACADVDHRLLRKIEVTPANSYDGHHLISIIDTANKDPAVYVDKSYESLVNHIGIEALGFSDQTIRKKPKGGELDLIDKILNPIRAQVRCGIEHVFGDMKGPIKALIRTVGLARARIKLFGAAIAYNIRRIMTLHRRSVSC